MERLNRQPVFHVVRVALAALAVVLEGRLASAAGPTEISSCTTITEPGSYVVVNNLTSAEPGDCLIVAANFVTIDLNGFVIQGKVLRPTGRVGAGIVTSKFPFFLPGPAFGVYTGFRGITVHDGTVMDFADGVLVAGSAVHLERLRALQNKRYGIFVSDCLAPYCDSFIWASGLIKDSLALRNGSDGITFQGGAQGGGAVISGNTSVDNNGAGIVAQCPAAVVGNTATTIDLGSGGCVNAHNAIP